MGLFMEFILNTEFGLFKIIGTESYIKKIIYLKDNKRVAKATNQKLDSLPQIFQNAVLQLKAFFEGQRRDLDFPIEIEGTSFQQNVWNALQKIPYGEVRTYGEIAHSIGNPKSVRAVGGACNKNPLPFIIPCHRVVASNGQGGFALGPEMKRKLLELESQLSLF